MNEPYHFIPASSLTLDAFADLYTRSFANYFYPMTQTLDGFAARVRTDHIDLYRSVVMMWGETPIGEATMAIRGDRAWCGGFGIVPEYRGRKLGPPLFAEFVSQARQAGMKTLQLEALTRNAAALSVYISAGMRPVRETRLLEWKRERVDGVAIHDEAEFARSADMARIAECFGRLHPVTPTWSRDLPSLLLRKGLSQIYLTRDEQTAAYVLFAAHEGAARIADVGAEDVAQAAELLAQLQSHYSTVVIIDAPADSPITAAFDQAGFHEFDRQYELLLKL